MALSNMDSELHAHKSWLGLVQPVGLVVSPPALSKAQVVLERNAGKKGGSLPFQYPALHG
ncbi:MAG TPA: hypothetical protein PKE31_17560 [Pseudomonadota bacterium]|nr:hypothetical protein [Pseudomonadota bacterium]